MKVFIGADHGGANLGKEITLKLQEMGYDAEYTKLENNPTDDYPDFAFDVCQQVLKDKENLGILICSTGIGISIAANKVKGIRCARIVSKEDAYYAKNHNNANIISFGNILLDTAMELITTFLNTEVSNEERHQRRINKIIKYEEGTYDEL